MINVLCPYCGGNAKLIDSILIYGKSYGMVWSCLPCDAYVGTHKGSKEHIPLGRLANRELRYWKGRAHEEFDKLWKTGRMTRRDAYKTMQGLMGMTPAQAHIGKFDVQQCKDLIALLNHGSTSPPRVHVDTLSPHGCSV
jgi:hypothetical protein